jgi:hypothetical protein
MNQQQPYRGQVFTPPPKVLGHGILVVVVSILLCLFLGHKTKESKPEPPRVHPDVPHIWLVITFYSTA